MPLQDFNARVAAATAHDKIELLGRANQVLFVDDAKTRLVTLPQEELFFKELAKTPKAENTPLRVGIFIGESFLTSMAPEIFANLDKIIILDANYANLTAIEALFKKIASMDNSFPTYTRKFNSSTKEEKAKHAADDDRHKRTYEFLNVPFGGTFGDDFDLNLDYSMPAGKDIEGLGTAHGQLMSLTMNPLDEKHFLFSEARFAACQKAFADALDAKKIIFKSTDVCSTEHMAALARAITGDHGEAEIVYFYATNIASLNNPRDGHIEHIGEYPLAISQLPFATSPMILATDVLNGDNGSGKFRMHRSYRSLDEYLRTDYVTRIVSVFTEIFKTPANAITSDGDNVLKSYVTNTGDTIFHLLMRDLKQQHFLNSQQIAQELKQILNFARYLNKHTGSVLLLDELKNRKGETPLAILHKIAAAPPANAKEDIAEISKLVATYQKEAKLEKRIREAFAQYGILRDRVKIDPINILRSVDTLTGDTLFHLAIRNNNQQLLEEMLTFARTINAETKTELHLEDLKNKDGKTPQDLLSEKTRTTSVSSLASAFQQLNVTEEANKSLLTAYNNTLTTLPQTVAASTNTETHWVVTAGGFCGHTGAW